MSGATNQMPEQRQKKRLLKKSIIILSVLLLLSAGALAARYVYLNFFTRERTIVTVPDNISDNEGKKDNSDNLSDSVSEPEFSESSLTSGVTNVINSDVGREKDPSVDKEEKAAVLELFQGKSGDNEKFEAHNMLPGDSVTKYFCVKISHDRDISLYFNTEIKEQTKNLGGVTHIKVTNLDTGNVICDVPFSKADKQEFSEYLKKSTKGETTVYYRIDVSVDTSVGNEYQAAGLTADFNWYVKDDSGLAPPQTGDSTNIVLWCILAIPSAVLVLLLLIRRKEEKSYEQA